MFFKPKKYSSNTSKPHKIVAFDVETYGEYNKFYMGSVYDDSGSHVFYNKDDMKDYLLKVSHYKRKCFLVATNLMFDFFVLWNDYDDMNNFDFIFRGSELIIVTHTAKVSGKIRKVNFIDTFSFATKLSLKKLGEIIGVQKGETPSFIGEKPKNRKEKDELEKYNINDSKVTYLFTRFFEDSLIKLGAELKPTISSIALNYFRLKYLKQDFKVQSHKENQIIFKAYYGGRTEAFKRGKIENLYYYDFNSLYPSCMLNELPDTNNSFYSKIGGMFYINNYEGVMNVRVRTPKNMKIPFLPYRLDNKLVFPLGEFTGYYTFVELRKALSLGYEILDFGETIFYTNKLFVFKDYVLDNYKLRMKYKSENNPIEFVYKIILNSTYGKMAQRYEKLEKIHLINDFDFSSENMSKYYDTELMGDHFIRTIKQSEKPKSFTIPIWSAYITSFARIKLFEVFERVGFENVYYCDTDSIFTSVKLDDDLKLGGLKLECLIKDGIIIKPKFYDINGKVRAKGLRGFNRRENLLELIDDPKFKSFKFTKFKESLRRKDSLKVNQIIEITKHIDLEDTKRVWRNVFNHCVLEDSNPLYIN